MNGKANVSEELTFEGGCHCDLVKFTVTFQKKQLRAWDCSCSDCYMRRNVHVIVPAQDFQLVQGKEQLSLYEWGTKTAKRYFCRTCGILPYYIPRSNPNGVAVTLPCISWKGRREEFQIEVIQYDGKNWEKSYHQFNIKQETEPGKGAA